MKICFKLFFSVHGTLFPKELSRKKRLVTGQEASIEDFPFVARTFYEPGYSLCMGLIISPRHIVTAGHCTEYYMDTNFTVKVGKNDYYDVANFTVHPNYQLNKYRNSEYNIAVLKLQEPIKLDNKTEKVIEMFEQNEEIKPGNVATVPGYGALETYGPTLKLRRVDVVIIDKKACDEIYEKIKGHQNRELCTLYVGPNNKTQSVACGEFFGNPVIISGRLAGIVVNGAPYGQCNTTYPNIFTDITYFREWIDQFLPY